MRTQYANQFPGRNCNSFPRKPEGDSEYRRGEAIISHKERFDGSGDRRGLRESTTNRSSAAASNSTSPWSKLSILRGSSFSRCSNRPVLLPMAKVQRYSQLHRCPRRLCLRSSLSLGGIDSAINPTEHSIKLRFPIQPKPATY